MHILPTLYTHGKGEIVMEKEKLIEALTFMLEHNIITFEQYNELYQKSLPFIE